MNIGWICAITIAGSTTTQNLEDMSSHYERDTKSDIHAKNSELEVSKTVAKLEKRQRNEERDESTDKDTGEDVIW